MQICDSLKGTQNTQRFLCHYDKRQIYDEMISKENHITVATSVRYRNFRVCLKKKLKLFDNNF